MQKELNIIATIIAQPGKRQAVIDAVQPCVVPSRAEVGCYLYTFHVDKKDDHRFVFIEKWTNEEALDAHTQTPHFLAMAEKLKPILDGWFDVQFLEEVL